jgi:hypothetical protein
MFDKTTKKKVKKKLRESLIKEDLIVIKKCILYIKDYDLFNNTKKYDDWIFELNISLEILKDIDETEKNKVFDIIKKITKKECNLMHDIYIEENEERLKEYVEKETKKIINKIRNELSIITRQSKQKNNIILQKQSGI